MAGSTLQLAVKATKKPKKVPKMTNYKLVVKAKKGKTFNKKSRSIGVTSMFPTRKFVKMHVSFLTAVTSGTTQSTFGNAQTYFLNSIFEPRSGSTTRPQGYAELSPLYARYKVYGAFVKIVFNNPTLDGVYVGVRAQQSGGSDSLAAEQIGNADMKRWTICKPINNTGTQTVYYSRYWDIAQMEGFTKTQMSADLSTMSAAIGANPSRVPFIEVACANAATTADAPVNFQIDITYYVQLFDRVVFPNS